MIDPQTGSTPVRVTSATGEERMIPKLSPRQIIALGNEITEGRRAKLKQNCIDASVAADAMAEKLNEFDSRPVTRIDMLNYIGTIVGQAHVAAYGLDGEADAFDPAELYRIAAERLGFQVKPAGDTKNPPDEGGSTNPTGSPTPPA